MEEKLLEDFGVNKDGINKENIRKEKLESAMRELSTNPFQTTEELIKKIGVDKSSIQKIYSLIQSSPIMRNRIIAGSDYSNQIKVMQELLLDADFWQKSFSGEKVYPREVELHLSKKCNRNCNYCWSKGIDYSEQKELADSEWENLLADLARNGVKRITFSGGKEPLLAPLGPYRPPFPSKVPERQ